MTPTTTWAAIRVQMASTIRAITPDSLTGEAFRLTQSEMSDFRSYADANDQSVLREFEIELGSTAPAGVSNADIELIDTDAEIVVAYPHHWGAYSTAAANDRANEATMDAVIEQDANAIAKAVGYRGSANYLDGQLACIEDAWSAERGEGVSFLVIPVTVTYYRAS